MRERARGARRQAVTSRAALGELRRLLDAVACRIGAPASVLPRGGQDHECAREAEVRQSSLVVWQPVKRIALPPADQARLTRLLAELLLSVAKAAGDVAVQSGEVLDEDA